VRALATALVAALVFTTTPARAQEQRPSPPDPDPDATTPEQTAPDGPLEGGDGGEGPGGSIDADDVEIPPLDPLLVADARTEGDRAAFAIRSRVKELASARVDAARDRSEGAVARLEEVTRRYVGEAAEVQQRADRLDDTQLGYTRLVERYRQARDDLQRRVTLLYAAGPAAALEATVRSGDVLEAGRRDHVIASVVDAAQLEVVDRFLDALDGAPGGIDEERAEIFEVREYLEDLAGARAVLRESADLAAAELDTVVGEVVPDIVFPIAGTEYHFIDSYLFCRDGCRRRHQGVDIMAPHGTPLLAVENGVLFRLGTGRLGGIKLWLLGESGTAYYYAHLSGYAEAAEEGAFVRAGTPIGFVGDTGNAVGTPPHLHLEVHPNARGRAVNPYPLMRQAADLRENGPDPLDGIG
jgi:septal ring factor EnvC (AmiA/AmiB activator)